MTPEMRQCLVDVLIHHWATPTSGCTCGGVKLGASWPEHVADVFEASMRAANEQPATLWAVQNGYRGNGFVVCLVETATKQQAITVAAPLFRAKGEAGGYSPDYWEELDATEVRLPLLTEMGG